jgi:hypothetical protein
MLKDSKWQPSHRRLLRRQELAQPDVISDHRRHNAKRTTGSSNVSHAGELGGTEEEESQPEEAKEGDEGDVLAECHDAGGSRGKKT